MSPERSGRAVFEVNRCYKASPMCRWLALVGLLWCATALAQDDTPDAADIPDASVGKGGAAITSPDMEDTSTTTCLSDSDCDQGFVCNKGKCEYRRYRDAKYLGCSRASGILGVGLVALLLRRSCRRTARRAR